MKHYFEPFGLLLIQPEFIKSLSDSINYEHKDKPFFRELITFMSSGECMVLVLKKENAVKEWRKTIGNTNPEDADKGTIRKLYANSIGENAVHGSDSDENAVKEIGFLFSDSELIMNQ